MQQHRRVLAAMRVAHAYKQDWRYVLATYSDEELKALSCVANEQDNDMFVRLETSLGVRWTRTDYEQAKAASARAGKGGADAQDVLYLPLAAGLRPEVAKFIEDQFKRSGGANASTRARAPKGTGLITDISQLPQEEALRLLQIAAQVPIPQNG